MEFSSKETHNPELMTGEREDYLSIGLGISFGMHALLLAFALLKAVFYPLEKLEIADAIKVDIIALPDKTDNPKVEKEIDNLPTPPPTPVNKPNVVKETSVPEKSLPKVKEVTEKKDPEALNLNKDRKLQDEAIKKLKAQSAIEEFKKEMALATAKQTSAQKIKGNVLAAGTALRGLDRLQHESYVSSLDQQIKQHWYLPEWLAKKNYQAKAQLRINQKGEIISRLILKPSGNSSYDELVLETIDKAAPFSPPPEKFIDVLANEGVMLGFPE